MQKSIIFQYKLEWSIEYWRDKQKSEVLRKCNVCQKYQGGPFKMPSISLWSSDKVIRSLPFQCTGLAYFDPLYIKCGNHADRRKVSVCLFTCVTVRAIHLEIVAHLSAEKCLLALWRFIARRGKPQQIVLDNACTLIQINKVIIRRCLVKRSQRSRISITYCWAENQIVMYSPTISMDGRVLWEINRNQQNGSMKSNWKDMPRNVTTPNVFDRNGSNY